MKNFWSSFLACLLAIVVGGFVFSMMMFSMLGAMMAAFSSEETAYVDYNSVLKIDLSENIMDNPPVNLLGTIDPLTMQVTRSTSLLSVLNAIEQAADDERIEGIYLNITSPSVGMGMMEEIRTALARFKEKSGKFILSYSNYYTQGAYYLSSVADKVYVNPEGAVEWKGMASTLMFFKGTLDKLGIKPEVYRVGEFKSAVEPFILDRMSAENRRQYEVLLNSIWDNIVSDIAKARRLDSAVLQGHASTLAVTNPQRAVELGLIDGVKYADEVLAEMNEKVFYDAEENVEFVTLTEYISAPGGGSSRRLSKNEVALVYAEGDIVDGGAEEGAIGGDDLAQRLAAVRQDDNVKAVVLRINSGGGSALASEVIWREMTLLQKEKPIVVSMGDYAASGGYYIACPADAIVADKYTLTGSIGVFGLMFKLEDAFRNKLGITTDVVKTNPSGDVGNAFRETTPAERMYIQNSVEDVYRTFVGHVAEGRNLSRERVLDIAGGRVWSGLSAQEIGLVDGHGGLKDAIALAADRAGISDDFRVTTPMDELDQLQQLLNSFFTARIKSTRGMSLAERELINEYRSLTRILEQEGVQARMPYKLQIQ
ncbi:signal peptide peptidase SppA [Alistipes sp. OttesenSCG-928-L06]|nr:signal peptide peptidase SppA [Alistipes sp. OttesenSCG-928-L06]